MILQNWAETNKLPILFCERTQRFSQKRQRLANVHLHNGREQAPALQEFYGTHNIAWARPLVRERPQSRDFTAFLNSLVQIMGKSPPAINV
jgi:hypothetical protein